MGVEARIVLYAPSEQQAQRAAGAAFDRIAQLDAVMSDYRAGSELNQLTDHPVGTSIRVSDDLYHVLATGQRVAEASGGAFDVTIGPLVALWREARRTGRLPYDDELARARQRVGFASVHLHPNDRSVTFDIPKMQLDLGGVAKGYAAEQAVSTLRAHEIRSALVSLAGDVAVSDAPPGTPGWMIAIDHGEPSRVPRVLLLANAAVSTSGSTEQFVDIAGKRYSHLIDPRTGVGLTSLTAATVIARDGDGALADALSSAACVLGPHAGEAMVAQFPECTVIFSDSMAGVRSDTEAGTERSR